LNVQIGKLILVYYYVDICQLSQGGRATEKALDEAIKLIVKRKPFCTNGTAVEGVCVTGEADRQLVPLAWQGTVPVGKPVWRGICCHGVRGLLCYRGTSSLFINDSNV